ncbi:MAG TPA: transketolase [Bacteroidales bacterium]|nr:transketolase [Bacteroidales bacterium]
MSEIAGLQRLATQVRRDIIRMVHAAESGHPGGSLGCADFLTAMYFKHMRHNPHDFQMNGIGEDVFFLSNGHISPVFYSVLARSGYFPVEELRTFRQLNSRLQGHPATHEGLPGVRIASGSLGQGLSVAIGAAQGKKLNKDPFLVYVLMGDGEIEEGQVWEAAMYAGAREIDNLIAIIDLNGQQIDGPVSEVLPQGDVAAKWKSFGWEVLEMNGNDMNDILSVMEFARSKSGQKKPVMILMHTVMGYGVDFMSGTHHWHGVAPNDAQAAQALAQLPETHGDY